MTLLIHLNYCDLFSILSTMPVHLVIIMMAFRRLNNITIPRMYFSHSTKSSIAFNGSQALFQLNAICAPSPVLHTQGRTVSSTVVLIAAPLIISLVTLRRPNRPLLQYPLDPSFWHCMVLAILQTKCITSRED